MTTVAALRNIVALSLAFATAACTPARHDVVYYLHHDQERQAKLHECATRGTQSSDPECIAADRAGAEKAQRAPSVLSSPL